MAESNGILMKTGGVGPYVYGAMAAIVGYAFIAPLDTRLFWTIYLLYGLFAMALYLALRGLIAGMWALLGAIIAGIMITAFLLPRPPIDDYFDQPLIKASGKPKGGILVDPGCNNCNYQVEHLRGHWTLVVFSAWGDQDWNQDLVGQSALHYSEQLWQQRATLGPVLNYLHGELAPLGVKLWIVRIDAAKGTNRPTGYYDRYLLGAQKTEAYDPAIYGRWFRPVYSWMLKEWIQRYFPPSEWKNQPIAKALWTTPIYGVLSPSGELMMLTRRGEAWQIRNDVLLAMGEVAKLRYPVSAPNDPVRRDQVQARGFSVLTWNRGLNQ